MSKNIRQISTFSLWLTLCALLATQPANTSAQEIYRVEVQQGNGLNIVAFSAPAGVVRVYLPLDTMAGDTISGTVYAEPAGKEPNERANNQGQLSGCVVEIAGQRQSAWQSGDKAFITFVLSPDVVPPNAFTVVLHSGGQTISSSTLPLQPTTASSLPGGFQLPAIAQQGRPLSISGPFDGNLANTNCSIGERPAEMLAESPRQTILKSPVEPAGLTEISLKEGETETKGPIRNLGVQLTAPKTNLLRGEKTTLTIKVIGLQALESSIPLKLDCTGAVRLQGGNQQNLEITPAQVQSDGSFSQTFGLVATQAGTFNVTGTILLRQPPAQQPACACKCEFTTPPILAAGKRNATGGGTEYGFSPNVKTGCSGNRCSIQSIAYTWSIGAGSTATYSIHKGTDSLQKLVVDVTEDGILELTVTVTVTCSDGTTCAKTGSKTFTVKK